MYLGSYQLCYVQIWKFETIRVANEVWSGENVSLLLQSLETRDTICSQQQYTIWWFKALQRELFQVTISDYTYEF